jgi:hypothetical protein
MALPARIPGFEPLLEALPQSEAAARIRRCTFRRLSRVPAGPEMTYAVSCLYPDRRLPLPLGDLESSLAICEGCEASHIFRPDEG